MVTLTMDGADTAIVGPEGRVLIPAAMRRALGIEPGARVKLVVEDDGCIRITTPEIALQRFRKRMAELGIDLTGVVDELLADRRAEVAAEEAKWGVA